MLPLKTSSLDARPAGGASVPVRVERAADAAHHQPLSVDFQGPDLTRAHLAQIDRSPRPRPVRFATVQLHQPARCPGADGSALEHDARHLRRGLRDGPLDRALDRGHRRSVPRPLALEPEPEHGVGVQRRERGGEGVGTERFADVIQDPLDARSRVERVDPVQDEQAGEERIGDQLRAQLFRRGVARGDLDHPRQSAAVEIEDRPQQLVHLLPCVRVGLRAKLLEQPRDPFPDLACVALLSHGSAVAP